MARYERTRKALNPSGNSRSSWNSLARSCGWKGEGTAFSFLAEKLKDLAEQEETAMPYPREQYVHYAKAAYETDDLEIDDNAKVSRVDGGDDGCWVAAWVWVPDTDLAALETDPDREKLINEIVEDRLENFDLRDYLKSLEPELRQELALLSDTELKKMHQEIFED